MGSLLLSIHKSLAMALDSPYNALGLVFRIQKGTAEGFTSHATHAYLFIFPE